MKIITSQPTIHAKRIIFNKKINTFIAIWFRITRQLLVALVIIQPSLSLADCNFLVVPFAVTTQPPNIDVNLNTIPTNGAIGKELISSINSIAECNGGTTLSRLNLVLPDSTNYVTKINGRSIFKTSNPAIGYAYGFEATNFCPSKPMMWGTASGIQTNVCPALTANTSYLGRHHVQLYKIGKITTTAGISFPQNTLGARSIISSPPIWSDQYLNLSAFNLTVSTCMLQSSNNIAIKLPDVYSNNFLTNGFTTGTTPFSISVNCPSPTLLAITFTDNNNIGQTTNILKPAAASTAKGLGIQLKYNGNIISFGPDSAEPGTTNQIVLNSNLAGVQSFPFTASYIRTGTVTPGTMSATATFTLSYQ